MTNADNTIQRYDCDSDQKPTMFKCIDGIWVSYDEHCKRLDQLRRDAEQKLRWELAEQQVHYSKCLQQAKQEAKKELLDEFDRFVEEYCREYGKVEWKELRKKYD